MLKEDFQGKRQRRSAKRGRPDSDEESPQQQLADRPPEASVAAAAVVNQPEAAAHAVADPHKPSKLEVLPPIDFEADAAVNDVDIDDEEADDAAVAPAAVAESGEVVVVDPGVSLPRPSPSSQKPRSDDLLSTLIDLDLGADGPPDAAAAAHSSSSSGGGGGSSSSKKRRRKSSLQREVGIDRVDSQGVHLLDSRVCFPLLCCFSCIYSIMIAWR